MGSEMCIRDSFSASSATRALNVVSCLLRLAFIFDGLSGCGFPHPNATAFYSLTAGPNSGVHLTPSVLFRLQAGQIA